MKKLFLMFIAFMMMNVLSFSQSVGISETLITPNPSSILELRSTTKGFLIPRMTSTERANISNPATGLLVYQTNGTSGYYYYNGTTWFQLGAGSLPAGTTGQTLRYNGTSWAGTSNLYNDGTKIGIGTTTPGMQLELTGSLKIPEGSSSTTGVIFKGANRFIHDYHGGVGDGYNTFVGINSGNFTITGAEDWEGSYNVGLGYYTLKMVTTGYNNTAIGGSALASNTTGHDNTGNGASSLRFNQTGNYNAALGSFAGYSYTTNSFSGNSLFGYMSGYSLTTGSNNILMGYKSGDNITTGSNNIIIGYDVNAPSATGTNQVVIGASDLLYGDLTSKRIGLGTSSPDGNLHLNNNADMLFIVEADANNSGESDNPRIEIRQDGNLVRGAMGFIGGDNSFYLNSEANSMYLVNEFESPMFFGTDSTIDVTISSTGQLGIGTTSPLAKLSVEPSSGTMMIPPIINYEKGIVIKDGAVNGGSDFEIQDSDGDVKFIVADNGNVGIGTSSPTSELQVIGRAKVSELEITGGSDIAEPFDTECLENIEPGMVLCIDSEHPGRLKLSSQAYDHCVAGIVSGAGNIETGLVLRQEGSEADGKHMVALSGRVYCRVDASFGAIQPGDLLTTSSTPGYAMKAEDHLKSQGAVIGKAMTSLESSTGLVLVLVSLQ